MDFADIIVNSAHRYGDRVAVWCEGRTQTYSELFDRSCRLANLLGQLGLVKGDRVAVLSANAFETAEQIIGIALGGFVRCGLYTHETGEVNRYLLDLVDARVLIAHASVYSAVEPMIGSLDRLEAVLVFGGDVPAGARNYDDLVARSRPANPGVSTAADDVHVIRFSAGTTGRPKGIVHTVGQWMANNDEYRWVTPQIDERDAYLAAGQLTHAAVLWFWPILQVGGRLVVMESFDAGHALDLIESQRPTVTFVVPTMVQAMLAHPDIDNRDLSSLRCANYAGAPMAERTMTRALERFGPVLYQLYAQSEAITISMLLPHQHDPQAGTPGHPLTRSVGRPTPNASVKAVDEQGRELPPFGVGEIAVKAPGQMRGLWKDPAATEQRLLPDGSLLTRDVGYCDEQGFMFLADRKEDMIISGGHNIWPAELENAIASVDGVHEVCVIGVPHDKWGETPRAYVVLEDGAEVDEQVIIDRTRERAGPVKKVTSVKFVEALPKSGVGKILRRAVREQFEGHT